MSIILLITLQFGKRYFIKFARAKCLRRAYRVPTKSRTILSANYLETALDQAAAAKPNPGRPAVYRLNRFQYANAIRDLIDLEVDSASLLPADDSGYGFDNIGDVLTVSPTLLEKYLSAAAKISRLAIGDPSISLTSTEYQIPPATVQTERESDDLPIGSRGGIAVRHHFPLDAEYVIKVRLQRGKDATTILGTDKERQLDIRLDGVRVKLFTLRAQGRAGFGTPQRYRGR